MSAAISAKLLPKLDKPVDLNRKFRGRRILGDHKTFRGLISGSLVGTIIYVAQIFFYSRFNFIQEISFFDYSQSFLLIGLIMGFGALFGDMVKSFFKRQLDFKPGQSWFFFDQVDWLIGSLILSWPFTKVSITIILLTIAIGVISHVIVKFLGFVFKLDKEPI